MARELLEKYIGKVPFLHLVGSFSNPRDAFSVIRGPYPDIIFLDIAMPEMTGFEFLGLLPAIRPAVIMVTADPSFAIDGFDQQVTDYLLKPASFERFMRAVNKAAYEHAPYQKNINVHIQPNNAVVMPAKQANLPESGPPLDFLLVKQDGKQKRIEMEAIFYIEGMKDYLKLYCTNGVVITHMTMGKIDEVLSDTLFIRINRSYIVNKTYIMELAGNELTVKNGKKLPIGVTYREKVAAAFKRNRI